MYHRSGREQIERNRDRLERIAVYVHQPAARLTGQNANVDLTGKMLGQLRCAQSQVLPALEHGALRPERHRNHRGATTHVAACVVQGGPHGRTPPSANASAASHAAAVASSRCSAARAWSPRPLSAACAATSSASAAALSTRTLVRCTI